MSELALVQRRPSADLVRSRAAAGARELARAVSHAGATAHAGARAGLQAVQTKLLVGAAHDPLEHEAERMADAVSAGRPPSLASPLGLLRLAQRAIGKGEQDRQEEERKRRNDEGVKHAQKSAVGPQTAPPEVGAGVESGILTRLGGGAALDPALRHVFEPQFGYDFSAVRVHTDPSAAGAARALGARAFTVGQDVFFGAGEFQPSSPAGRHLIAHELTHTIQQTPSTARPSRLLRAPRMVQRWEGPIDRARARIADYLANDFPPWELITLIIGRDPVRDRPVTGATRDWIRAAMRLAPDGLAMFEKLDREGQIDAVARWWDTEVAKLNLTLDGILALVRRAWDALEISDALHPLEAWNEKIKPIFAPTVQRVWTFIRNVAIKVFQVIRDLVLRYVGNWAKEQRGYPLLTMAIGRDPVTGQTVTPTLRDVIFAVLDLVPGGQPIKQNLERSHTVERAAAWFRAEFRKMNITVEGILSLFTQAWDAFHIQDLLHPVNLVQRIWAIFRPTVVRVLTFIVAVAKKVLEFIFEGAMILAGPIGVRIVRIVRRVGATFDKIVDDPVAFVRHLVDAVKRGFRQFGHNIWTHLRDGLVAWLVGALEGAGLTLPQVWDLRGVLDLTLQVLGITYAKMRVKLVRILGEPTVAMLERVFTFIKALVTEGPAAAWREIVAAVGSLWDMVIGGIKDWAISRIVTAAITRLATMFNPVGAIIQAIIATYNTIAFFIERIHQIADLVESVVDSVAEIAEGKIAQAANYVERTMARTIPVILGFLARLIGLGDISGEIRRVIVGLQARVDSAIDRVLDWVVEQARRLLGRGDPDAAPTASESKSFTMAGETHTIAVTGQGGGMRVTIASGAARRLHDRAVAARTEVLNERPPRPTAERDDIVRVLDNVAQDSREDQIWYAWQGQGAKSDLHQFLVLKIDRLIQDLAPLSQLGIKSLDALFTKIPGIRKLPAAYQSGNWVRQNLYVSSSEWSPKQQKIVQRDKPSIKQRVAQANASHDQSVWNSLIGPTAIGKYIPETAVLGQFQPADVDSVSMAVDHVHELAIHWQQTGHNSDDDERHRVAFDDESNLELVTARYNSAKPHGSYTPLVDESFESKKRNSTLRDRKIAGQFFLRADGSELT